MPLPLDERFPGVPPRVAGGVEEEGGAAGPIVRTAPCRVSWAHGFRPGVAAGVPAHGVHGLGIEVRDDAGLPGASDTLDHRTGTEALDEGRSPPERPWGMEHTGVTASERRRGESLDERLAEEVPGLRVLEGDGLGGLGGSAGELIDDEVGDARAGRLVAPDESSRTNTESGLFASGLGLDGAGSSAEEAAMHVMPGPEPY